MKLKNNNLRSFLFLCATIPFYIVAFEPEACKTANLPYQLGSSKGDTIFNVIDVDDERTVFVGGYFTDHNLV